MHYMLLQKATKLLITTTVVAIAALSAGSIGQTPVASASAPDYDIPNGHFFTQTAPPGSAPGAGFSITDDNGIPFWTVYQRDGGLLQLGFPLTRRFIRDGFVTQVLQKAVLQWHSGTGRVEFVNVLDEMNNHGLDDWLAERLVPRHLMTDDGHLPWAEIVRTRLALLNDSDALRRAYHAVPDPMRFYGLPTTGVVDYGPMETIRLQRAALQLWKVKTDFAEPGQVVVANGGDLAFQAGLFPAGPRVPLPSPLFSDAPPATGDAVTGAAVEESDSSTPQSTDDTVTDAPVEEADSTTSESTEDPAADTTVEETDTGPPQPTGDAVIDRVNTWRAIAGMPAIAMSAELMRAAQSHADYYIANADHPSIGQIGVHREQPGLPGFTGQSIYDRAKAAGYPGNWIDEDISFDTDAVENVDIFVTTVFHRFALLHPSTVAVGYGVASGNGRGITVINIGLEPSHQPGVDLPAVYPAPGQSGVPRLWYAYESPDPVPGLPRPVGSPLTVSFLLGQTVEWGPVSLTSANGDPVEVVVVRSNWRRSIGITPARPLLAGTEYTATVSGTVDGQPFSKTWSFTTAQSAES